MKPSLPVRVLIASAAVALALALCILPSMAAENLLKNGGFEKGTGGWRSYRGTLSRTGSPVHSGNFAASLATNAKLGYIYQDIEISPEGTYTFSGYAVKNNPDIERVYLRISWCNENGVPIAHHDSPCLTSDKPNYRHLAITHSAPSNACSARIRAMVEQRTAGGSVTAYFDDLSFTGPPPPPAQTETVATAPASSPTSTEDATQAEVSDATPTTEAPSPEADTDPLTQAPDSDATPLTETSSPEADTEPSTQASDSDATPTTMSNPAPTSVSSAQPLTLLMKNLRAVLIVIGVACLGIVWLLARR